MYSVNINEIEDLLKENSKVYDIRREQMYGEDTICFTIRSVLDIYDEETFDWMASRSETVKLLMDIRPGYPSVQRYYIKRNGSFGAFGSIDDPGWYSKPYLDLGPFEHPIRIALYGYKYSEVIDMFTTFTEFFPPQWPFIRHFAKALCLINDMH